jgi:pimeloyl-ACP methyl ester carboxylesterase
MNTVTTDLTITETLANREGAPTFLFVHGFLDDATVWGDVTSVLADKANTVSYDLPGFGSRTGSVSDIGHLTLESLAAEAADIVTGLGARVIVVGQSMGSQVAEMLAADHPDQVAGLVLLTPVPLTGTHLPDEAIAPFRALGGDVAAQRAARAQLSPSLGECRLDRLTAIGAAVLPGVVARYADVWNAGVADASAVSAFTGPVLLIRGGADGFVTEQLLAIVRPRFPQARVDVIEGGGHWMHVEDPEEIADILIDFADGITDEQPATGWRRGFAEQSPTAFADEFAPDVVLNATTIAEPIKGRDRVATVMATASSIYETLEFTAESHNGTTTYLQWCATAFGGMDINGVTVLERGADGKVVSAAVHHRPLGAVLRFSAEIRDRLSDVIGAQHFLTEDR